MSVHDKYKDFVEDQRAFFDELITEDWASYNNSFWDFTRRFEIKQIMRQTSPQSILNVGSGCGFHDLEFSTYKDVTGVFGIDYSAKSIETANKHYSHPKIKRECFDVFTQADKVSEQFDLVTSFQVIEHLKDYKYFVTFLASKTKKNGFVSIATPNSLNFVNRVRKLFGKETLLCDPMHFKEFSLSEMKELGEYCGLTYSASFGYGFSFNVKYDLNKFIPQRCLFYLGRIFPSLANVIVVTFKKN